METNSQNSNRKQLRSYFKNQRDSMTSALAGQLSVQICDKILEWEVYQNAGEIYFYYPLEKEVSLLPVIYDALAAGRHIAFPKVSGNDMAFYEVTNLDELTEGCFHVMEPPSEERFLADWPSALCFVPGTAFDREGGRFGYGRGYYDRYFSGRNDCILAGCAYECQITDKLPTEEWDRRMDYMISEKGAVTTLRTILK